MALCLNFGLRPWFRLRQQAAFCYKEKSYMVANIPMRTRNNKQEILNKITLTLLQSPSNIAKILISTQTIKYVFYSFAMRTLYSNPQFILFLNHPVRDSFVIAKNLFWNIFLMFTVVNQIMAFKVMKKLVGNFLKSGKLDSFHSNYNKFE